MKFLVLCLVCVSFGAQANPFMSVKERLRIHLWTEGIQQNAPKKVVKSTEKPLPEELERAIRKF